MNHISSLKDTAKLTDPLLETIGALSRGAKRIDLEVEILEQQTVASLTGYWVGDLIRIDIKFHDVRTVVR